MIELKHVSKSYFQQNQRVNALDNINLRIEAGEICGIIGPSGAGKSTLLRTMNLLERPNSGEVLINGKALQKLNPNALSIERQKIGFIFQHFNLINNKTVFDNIACPLRLQKCKNSDKTINELLHLVSLTDKKQSYPSELSGGQKQRVAIARALTTKPSVLLCDEITSALDPATTEAILLLLKQINQDYGITIVLITHEMEVIQSICERVAVMEKGTMTSNRLITDILKSQEENHLFLDNLKPELPHYLKTKLQKIPQAGLYPLVQVQFYHEATQHPILSDIAHKTGININILQANIDAINDCSFGIVNIQLQGNEKKIEKTMAALATYKLKTEVLGYV